MTKLRSKILAGVLLAGFMLAVSACSARTAKETIRSHKILVIPAQKIAPRTVQHGDGQTERLDGYDNGPEAFMIVIRGRI